MRASLLILTIATISCTTPVIDGTRRAAAAPATSGDTTYHGGPLLTKVQLIPFFWSRNVQLQSQLATFYSTIVKGPYLSWLSEYDTTNPVHKIGTGSATKAVVDPAPPTGTTIDDTQIQSEIARLIDAGTLPKPNANTLYATHFPPGVTITFEGATSCEEFCNYHNGFVHKGVNVYYTVIPDVTHGTCAQACSYDNVPLDDTTVLASHELIDSITDPDGNAGDFGWWDDTQSDTTGGELAMICWPQAGTVQGYAVSLGWSTHYRQCIDSIP